MDEPVTLDALGNLCCVLRQEVSQDLCLLAGQLAEFGHLLQVPQEIRRLIYTTNTIEGFNRQLWKVAKAKSVFPTDDSLLKMLYLVMLDITKKWTGRCQDWSIIRAQLAVYFADRLSD